MIIYNLEVVNSSIGNYIRSRCFSCTLPQCIFPLLFFFYFASSTVFNANGDIILYFWLLHICTNTLCSCNITGTVVAILVLARLYKLLVSDLLSLTYTYHISHTKINNRGFFKFFRYNFLSIHWEDWCS